MFGIFMAITAGVYYYWSGNTRTALIMLCIGLVGELADCNLTVEVAVLLTLYVALTATYPDSAWKTLRRQLCRK